MLHPLVLLLLAAVVCDFKGAIIPNRLIMTGMGLAAIWLFATEGGSALIRIPLHAVFLLVCLWPLYQLGGLGAGDCKLLMLAGTFLPTKSMIPLIMGSFLIALPFAVVEERILRDTIQGKVHFSVPVLFAALGNLLWGVAGTFGHLPYPFGGLG